MQLVYGGTPVSDYGAAGVRFETQAVRNRAQQVYKLRSRAVASRLGIACYGRLDADARKVAIGQLLAQDGGDLELRAGGAATSRSIRDIDTLNGVRVVDGPNWSDRPGANGITFWDYSAVWEWEVARPLSSGAPVLLDFAETVTVMPGTPKVVEFNPVNTPGPILQITTGARAWRAVVSGQMVGAYSRPAAPPGLPDADPFVFWDAPPEVTSASGLRTGDAYSDFLVRWTYRYVSAYPLLLVPREWTG